MKDKRALVTGGGAGIGRCLALALARRGTHVWLVDKDPEGLARTASHVRELGVEAVEAVCDVSDAGQISRTVADLLDRWGSVDILVNNAGLLVYGSVRRVEAEQWRRVLSVNLEAPIQFVRELLPTLESRPQAHILNVASMHGLVGIRKIATYQTTKFALVGFSESLRADLRRTNIGVTALCPGYTRTEFMDCAENVNPRRPLKPPGRWICVSAERVAEAGIRAIRRNRGLVLVGWPAHLLHLAWRLSPRLFDFLRRIA